MEGESSFGAVYQIAGRDFRTYRTANLARAVGPTFRHEDGLTDWSPAEWGCALAGEVGELCDLLKKVRRGDCSPQDTRIGKEIADVFAYLDLTAARLSIDLPGVIVAKFNEVSVRHGAHVFLELAR